MLSTAANIVDVTVQNFQETILEGSQSKLVLVFFWADWNEPSMQLLPILEKLAAEHASTVVLAKLNCDEQQQLAAQFGVRNLPTVAFFKDGQPVDGFAGVEPETAIRERIQGHLPSPTEELIEQAMQQLEATDYETAYGLAKQAFDIDSSAAQTRLVLAAAALELGRLGQVRELLDSITMVDQDSFYQHLVSKLKIADEAADSPELRQLAEQLSAQPENLELKMDFAMKLFEAKRMEEALEQIFGVLRHDLNYADARQRATDMLNALPPGDPLATKYRRVLYSLLY
ncbi:co-chaperone YbbN [Pseudidiomarina aestuarii]|uniref:Co-chaperone YbbN n=1 Tax=Pseudidiomarina aestuarii TaxID=624146 RepID=A0A7Z7ET22_9GAMM|nr:tetratricopeptide repeat protein [Pseudidiomarina aestuarii]RUO40643.1 co-chaperone YbbN [Pseudidiomarina aestuarii]